MLKHLKHVLKTKGPVLAIRRLGDIFVRFILGRRRFKKLLREFDRVFVSNNIETAFFITGVLLKRHFNLFRSLKRQGHCLAVHGHYHVRMDRYSPEGQEELVNAGAAAFREKGLDPSGFRPPYLNYNQDTQEALRSAGYRWTSCRYLLDGFGRKHEGSPGKLKELYHISSLSDFVSIPYEEKGLIDIPVTGPDDELMVDRYRVSAPAEILEIWLEAWREIHLRGELYHLMFHPERFLMLSGQVERLISEIKREGEKVWIASLGEIAGWWERRQAVEVSTARDNDQLYAFFKELPEEASILLSSFSNETGKADQRGLLGCEVLDPVIEDTRGKGVICGDSRKSYVIGLSESCSDDVEQYLRNEGYITRRDVDPSSCSMWLDWRGVYTPEDERKLLREVESCRNPLVRLWRWPGRCQSAATFSADICAVDFWDFVARSWHFHRGEK